MTTIFSASNEQGSMKHGEISGVQKKLFGPSNFRYVPSVSRALASELVLQRGGLPSEIALPGGNLESKIVYRGVGADFENRKS